MENSIKALELKTQLDNLRPIDREKEARIMQKFRLNWNYHSNHLEGNSLTYGETKALILFGITAQGKPLQDHFEITGHNEAINWVIDVVKGDYPLNENFIRELHTLLLKAPYEVDAITPDGQPTKKRINVCSYKTSPNHVKTKTGEIFYFATPEETPSKMSDLMNWYREKIEQEDVNPIFLAAEFHYKFIRIHPFDDGNGRTARILMNFILMKFDFPPVIIKTEDKANYFAALQLADAGNIEAFIDYISQNLVRSLEIMTAGAKGESIEEEDDLDKEIALLEQRIKFSVEKTEIIRSKETIKNIYDHSIKRLYEKFVESGKKFEAFYNFSEVNFSFNNLDSKRNSLPQENDIIDENSRDINFKYSFKFFNKGDYDRFNNMSLLYIKFETNKYTIFGSGIISIDKICKNYSEKLTDEEISKIMTSVSQSHLKFIEQKIAEKENK
ncbi:COG3177 Fic family protein [Flavobacteriaceae bacterium]